MKVKQKLLFLNFSMQAKFNRVNEAEVYERRIQDNGVHLEQPELMEDQDRGDLIEPIKNT